ncbi:MAG: hypothetical protein ACRCVS_05920 [Fusobacteriaceae bacterium]
MFTEKTLARIDKISDAFSRRGYDYLKEDITELLKEQPDLAEKIDKIKFNNIEFFNDDSLNSIGFTLEDTQVEFFIEIGEDEDGPWYEASAEVLYFGGE